MVFFTASNQALFWEICHIGGKYGVHSSNERVSANHVYTILTSQNERLQQQGQTVVE
jgi:hypothetical protein